MTHRFSLAFDIWKIWSGAKKPLLGLERRLKDEQKEETENEYKDVVETETINSMIPIWKREKREDFLDTKKKDKQEHISMKWRF